MEQSPRLDKGRAHPAETAAPIIVFPWLTGSADSKVPFRFSLTSAATRLTEHFVSADILPTSLNSELSKLYFWDFELSFRNFQLSFPSAAAGVVASQLERRGAITWTCFKKINFGIKILLVLSTLMGIFWAHKFSNYYHNKRWEKVFQCHQESE